jgi:hypothetical protein
VELRDGQRVTEEFEDELDRQPEPPDRGPPFADAWYGLDAVEMHEPRVRRQGARSNGPINFQIGVRQNLPAGRRA